MRRKMIATLIICVTLVMQFGASLSGAAAARDGFADSPWCHNQAAVVDAAAPADRVSFNGKTSPGGAPLEHDHASCSFCQIGFTAALLETSVFEALVIEPYRRIALIEPASPATRVVFNRSAPARAPPSLI